MILLCHAFGATSEQFFLTSHSIGYYFVNNGYDVWCMNVRGNKFSLAHTDLSIRKKEYYNYTPHEIGTIDLIDTINQIKKATGKTQIII